jgi:hypothetical protein
MGAFDYKPSYRRNLPHLQPAGATLFVTFRLAGSLPKAVVEQWQQERKWLEHLEQTNPVHFARVKSVLRGTGSRSLNQYWMVLAMVPHG